ncbi:hypothetical protein PYCCODRAFT_1446592 [Trametes coccinea BRFM310]|uniref:Heterokaryon incompatibility domain-containing protein n=1 Tax=Trametes coccinea (strain BRFM310) TaxID=1353009 RepID=A0A1Y2IGK7_TRAC3|nr:hypothetical protein PYCCODRAFT_1446592 [Trametes coccinea BRFM310]
MTSRPSRKHLPTASLPTAGKQKERYYSPTSMISRAQSMSGWAKVETACAAVIKHGLSWIWIDTCCIDKSSSAELAKAINSMSICYAYLSDVPSGDVLTPPGSRFRSSRWFTRGWTLQKLLAPAEEAIFLSSDWVVLGTRAELAKLLGEITNIDQDLLSSHNQSLRGLDLVKRHLHRLRARTLSERMSAYSLMGIFDVNMAVLYGEGGEKAFRRLQLETIREPPDQTIFAWGVLATHRSTWPRKLAG